VLSNVKKMMELLSVMLPTCPRRPAPRRYVLGMEMWVKGASSADCVGVTKKTVYPMAGTVDAVNTSQLRVVALEPE
jgi:hypothetical protein